MEAESIKMVVVVLGGFVAIVWFMRSGFAQLRGEIQADREEFRGEIQSVPGGLHGLAARQREYCDRLSDKLDEVISQQHKYYDRLSERLDEVISQQRQNYDRLSDKYDQLSDKLAVTSERAVRIEAMLLRQFRQERQSQAVDSPTNVVEQKPAQAKAAQATPRS